MTYTIETLRTVNGPRYYIRRADKLLRGGFAREEAAQERIRVLAAVAEKEADYAQRTDNRRNHRGY